MIRSVLGASLLLAAAVSTTSASALPQPPHDAASGITCPDCHLPYGGPAGEAIQRVTSASGSTTQLVDPAQSWETDALVGGYVSFTSGANDGQFRKIVANTATTLRWTAPLPAPVATGDGYRLGRTTERDLQSLCQTCHNPTGMASAFSDVSVHVAPDGTVIGCGKCHDPHNLEPNSGRGAGLVRERIRWPTARNPVTHPAPGNPQIVGASPYNGICETCHTRTAYHRNGPDGDHGHNAGSACTSCHTHGGGFGRYDHEETGAVTPLAACMTCHGTGGPETVRDVHGAQCGLCHLDPSGGGPLVAPYESTAPAGGDCATCHDGVSGGHSEVSHLATPGSGAVVIFPDDSHDDAGWSGTPPYFDVLVDCDLCHGTDLKALHAGGCETCHPAAVSAVGTWTGGCREGSCHPTLHDGSAEAHLPFSDPYDPQNDCNRCHGPGVGAVQQGNCLNCHATYTAGDVTPPMTTSDAQASYVGVAAIRFSITDGGKVGVGTTFHRLDGGAAVSGSSLLVTTPGAHDLEFWSVDQAGNVETPANAAHFTVLEDTTPPTTTSDARSSYYQGARISLTATDASSLGVKTTFYRVDSGPTQSGTTVVIPATPGVLTYTLEFWSEDWSDNVETPHFATFSVTSGTATIRLVWGDSDVSGPPTHPDDWAEWYIRRGGYNGPLVAYGSGSNPGWSGVDDVLVPVSPTPYYVDIWWWDTRYGWDDNTVFPDVLLATPGELVRLSY